MALVAVAACEAPSVVTDGGSPGAPCDDEAACQDGVFCNGRERCTFVIDRRYCVVGTPPCTGLCDESGGGCGDCMPDDADRDGHAAVGCGGDDCNDANAAIHPGALEVCDGFGVDEDCIPATFGIRDDDRDGATANHCCNPNGDGYVCGPDCDDRYSAIGPHAAETCEGVDQDCDGAMDEGADIDCMAPGRLGGACIDGACEVGGCMDGRQDCDLVAWNGCETDVRTTGDHCGGCGHPCGATGDCVDGVCVATSCGPDEHRCPDVGCRSDAAVETCGTRCEVCPTIAGGTPSCTAGVCTLRCDTWGSPPGYDSEGRPTCTGTYPHVRSIHLTTPTDDVTLSGGSPSGIGAQRLTGSPVTITVELGGGLEEELTVVNGSEHRASGEPFDPRDLAEAGLEVPLEILEGGLPLGSPSRLVLRLRLYLDYVPVTILDDDLDAQFGAAVAVDGDIVVVGAPGDDSGAAGVDGDPSDESMPDAGSAYVFRRVGSDWRLEAYLKPLDPSTGASFGASVDVKGEAVIIGAPRAPSSDGSVGAGAAYVFRFDGSRWSEGTRLIPTEMDENDWFGTAVAFAGTAAAVGAPGEDGSGTGHDGDPTDDGHNGAGAVWVFEETGSSWTCAAYLKRPPGDTWSSVGSTLGGGEGTIVLVQRVGPLAFFERTADGWRFDAALGPFAEADGPYLSVDENGSLVAARLYAYPRVGGVGIWRRDAGVWRFVEEHDAGGRLALARARLVHGDELDVRTATGWTRSPLEHVPVVWSAGEPFVAIDGTTIVMGSGAYGHSGAAVVYRRATP